jgi:calcyphosin
MTLFKIYDLSGDGIIQYKEFTSVVLGRSVPQSARKGQAANPTDALMDRLRQKLKSRGAHGMIGLQRNFKIMDDNHSLSLDKYEFSKAMTDFMLGFNQTELNSLFEAFDTNRNGVIEYDEFLRQIRGPMNARREKMVDLAFAKLDKDGNGYVDINDLTGVYNGKFHPDVIAGKKTERQVLSEWLSTFDQHHNMRTQSTPDHIVVREEFLEYYNNISCSIDNDEYFEVMMTRCWDLDN